MADVLRRLNIIEGACADMQHALDVQFERIAAMQAQLDLIHTRTLR